MVNLKKEKIKKRIFLTILVSSLFIFIAGIMSTIMGNNSPVKFIVNGKPLKLVLLPFLVFLITFILYRNSKKKIERNIKKEVS